MLAGNSQTRKEPQKASFWRVIQFYLKLAKKKKIYIYIYLYIYVYIGANMWCGWNCTGPFRTAWAEGRPSCVCASRSVMSDSATPWTIAHQCPLSTGFSRQECWNGLPFPPPGDLPDTGMESGSPALQADSSLSQPPGKPLILMTQHFCFQESIQRC